MNYSRLLILLCFLIMGITGYTQTDTLKRSFPKLISQDVVQKEVTELSARLNLTEGQAKDAEVIESRFYNAYVVLMNTATSGLDRKKGRQQLQKDKEVALRKVLTPAQWTTYVSYMEERQKKVRLEIEQRRRRLQQANSGKQG